MKKTFYRCTSLVLALLMVLGLLQPIPKANAAQPASLSLPVSSERVYNPLYGEHTESEEAPLSTQSASLSPQAVPTYDSVETAGAALRSAMVNRKNQVVFHYTAPWSYSSLSDKQQSDKAVQLLNDLAPKLFEEALRHTGIPNEGDYLAWQYEYYRWSVDNIVDVTKTSITFEISYEFSYFTTAEQEAYVTKEVRNIFSNYSFYHMTEYERLKAIYDYICSNVTFDAAHEDADNSKGQCVNPHQHTAYAALKGKSVCQGYVTLLYRMALEAKLNCRILSSLSQNHGWNLIRVNGKYYELDSTWDSQLYQSNRPYQFFLRPHAEFINHPMADQYRDPAFAAAYPISETDFDPDNDPPIMGGPAHIVLDDWNSTINLAYTTHVYTGKALKPAVTITYTGLYNHYTTQTLVQDKDYTLDYYTNTDAGTATVRIFMTGVYWYRSHHHTITKTFKITPQSLSKATVTLSKTSCAYTGKAIKPAVTVKLGGVVIPSENYTVSYSNNTKIGTAKVTIKGKGSLTGSKTLSFSINPKAVTLSSVKKSGSKQLAVKWKKVSGMNGYRIQYAQNKKFTGAKTVTVKKDKTVSAKLTKLTKGKTYYVRIQSYKKVSGKTYYSAWSGTKSAKA